MDVHVHGAITSGLRRRGIDVLTAQDDHAAELEDDELLDRATKLERVLFSNDEDLLVEAATRQRAGTPFAGVIYAHELNVTIRQCIDDIELICAVYDPPEMQGRVEHVPLK